MQRTFAGSVKTSSAPKACSSTRLSKDMDAGMVRISLYPFAAATKASPMPVFPDVGSTRVVTPATNATPSAPSLNQAQPDLLEGFY